MKHLVLVIILFHWFVSLSAQPKLPMAYGDTLFWCNHSGGLLVYNFKSTEKGYCLADSFNQNIHTRKIMYLDTNTPMIEFECYDTLYKNIDVKAIPIFSIWHGKFIERYKNGAVKVTGNYAHNLRYGIFKTYTEDGKISEVMEWKNKSSTLINRVDSLFYSKIDNEIVYPMCTYENEPLNLFPEIDKFISKSIKYPKYARRKHIQGTVFVEFVVTMDRSLHDITVVKGVEKHLDEEAIRLVKALPQWAFLPEPSACQLKRYNFILPIKFSLKKGKKV